MRKPIISDEDLVKQYRQGDENSLRMLINRHQSKLFSYLLFLVKDRPLAEDIFQDAFVKIIKTLKKGKYTEEGKFYQWIVRIARNLVIDYYRKNNKMPTVGDSEEYDMMGNLPLFEENREQGIIREETEEKVRLLIYNLPHEQKEVLILRHYANLSFKEIAAITNVSINTSLGRMRYALLNLRKMIEEKKVVI